MMDWFDREIAVCKGFSLNKNLDQELRSWYYGKLNGLWVSKNRFAIFWALSITTPPQEEQTENEIPSNFTDGLD